MRQGGDADDDAGETVERGGNRADQTALMHPDKIRCELFGNRARTRRIDDRPAGKHLNGMGEAGAVAVRGVEILVQSFGSPPPQLAIQGRSQDSALWETSCQFCLVCRQSGT